MLVRPAGLFGVRELPELIRARFGRSKPAAGSPK
jgi:hypothetical protein